MAGAWWWLLAAGAMEVAWSQSIRPTEGFTRPWPTLLCFVLGASSVYLLSRAMETIAVGVAYTVFTGIGATGAVALGLLVSGDRLSAVRLAGLALLVGGLLVVRMSEG